MKEAFWGEFKSHGVSRCEMNYLVSEALELSGSGSDTTRGMES